MDELVGAASLSLGTVAEDGHRECHVSLLENEIDCLNIAATCGTKWIQCSVLEKGMIHVLFSCFP